ncbi:hypothetical protein Thiofri_00909 [Thiorhodovibrio frisius]|nr:hypothetical protein Thiofri_00909 [Thiorhodovibrio frisius]
MIASKDDDLNAFNLRALARLEFGKLAGKMLEPAEGAWRFGELVLTRFGAFAVFGAGLDGGDAEPFDGGGGLVVQKSRPRRLRWVVWEYRATVAPLICISTLSHRGLQLVRR